VGVAEKDGLETEIELVKIRVAQPRAGYRVLTGD